MLANAVYFLGKWQTAFDAKKTALTDFTLVDGEKAQVEMMNGEIRARYGLDTESGLQIAELPYRGKTKALVVLLPAKGNNALTQLKQQLDSENLEGWIAATKLGDVKVRLPKFSFRVSHNLNESLATMGGHRMFDLTKADFSGISDNPLALQMVKQMALIKVDESGTEAAAVTAGGVFGGVNKLPSPELFVDRPFLLLIRDVATGSILFVGQVVDPRAGE